MTKTMKIEHTERGFSIIEFIDRYKIKCSLQESSLAEEPAIWFGVDDPKPEILASDTPEGGAGWVDYYIPSEVSIHTRMHLTVNQVKELLPYLHCFVKTGCLEEQLHEYIFTFGSGQPNENCFHAIKARNPEEARAAMVTRFGRKWAMQYESREKAGVDKWSLKEIK